MASCISRSQALLGTEGSGLNADHVYRQARPILHRKPDFCGGTYKNHLKLPGHSGVF